MTPKEIGFKLAYELHAEIAKLREQVMALQELNEFRSHKLDALNLQVEELQKGWALCRRECAPGEFHKAYCKWEELVAEKPKHDHIWYADPTRGPGSFCRDCNEVWLPGVGEKRKCECGDHRKFYNGSLVCAGCGLGM